MEKPYLKLDKIDKSFGTNKVLDSVSLSVNKGEFVGILGSSGSGKTTILRIIAGLESPDAGSVFLDGRDITALPPEKRDVNMVFQNYALFEHMTVAENIGYSLKIRKVPKDERRKKVNEMLKLMDIEGKGDMLPSLLSGGQRQRVAIARAIINKPKMLLLDEPLGALDRNLRKKMQVELKELQKQIGITFIYITHDQEEALYLCDRIGILQNGNFAQIDTVSNIVNSTVPYVREFLGAGQTKNV